MTITQMIVDDNEKTIWLKAQTWGRVTYIDFDEWFDDHAMGLLKGIINIF